ANAVATVHPAIANGRATAHPTRRLRRRPAESLRRNVRPAPASRGVRARRFRPARVRQDRSRWIRAVRPAPSRNGVLACDPVLASTCAAMDGAISALCHPLPVSRGTTMADSKLSREHSLALLHKLANDDGFRSRYEQKPAAALAELGVPHETIANLKGSCLAPASLANKDHFALAHA